MRYTTQFMFHDGIPRRVRNVWTFHSGLGDIWQNKTLDNKTRDLFLHFIQNQNTFQNLKTPH